MKDKNDYQFLDSVIRKVPNFPHPPVLFYDITSLLANPEAFRFTIDKMKSLYLPRIRSGEIGGIVAVESRGFIFASPLALDGNIPLVLARKKGKLPGETYSVNYTIEYGEATLEVQKADIMRGTHYLVVDDLIATGGTLRAVRTLLNRGGAEVQEFFGVIGLPKLDYEKALSPIPVTTLIDYESGE